MKRCTTCILPATFPGISFDEDGVCSICKDFAEKPIVAPSAERLNEALAKIIEESKAQSRRYDAVVAFSGGKDSSFLLSLLKQKFDLRLLAVTFDNGFLPDSCLANINTVITALDIDHTFVTYPQDQLNRVFLESALAPIYPDHLTKFGSAVCISCIRMIMTAMLRIAIQQQVPMVMLGHSPGQLLRSEDEIIYQDNKIPFALRRQLFTKLAERVGPWVYDYLMLTADEYKTRPFPYIVNPLPMIGYDQAEIYRTIAGLGWQKPEDVDPNSTNCQLNAFGIIRHMNRYRFHPYDYEMSQLVRLGLLSRAAALAKVEDPEGQVEAIAATVERALFCGGCQGKCGGC